MRPFLAINFSNDLIVKKVAEGPMPNVMHDPSEGDREYGLSDLIFVADMVSFLVVGVVGLVHSRIDVLLLMIANNGHNVFLCKMPSA
jgi:hypothetical protein